MFTTMLLITLPHHRGTDSIAVLAGWKSVLHLCRRITPQNMLFMIVQIFTTMSHLLMFLLTSVYLNFRASQIRQSSGLVRHGNQVVHDVVYGMCI